ncbi:MAG: hypothetical protein LBV63_04685, partial [Candidatus Methanoplasma sp.]|nr:hypothetical protein [Candidatus Methanoplasma sp.]
MVQTHERALIGPDTDDKYDLYGDGDAGDRETYTKYRKYIKHKVLFLVACLALLFAVIVVSVNIGVIDIPFLDVLKYLFTFDTDGTGRIIW